MTSSAPFHGTTIICVRRGEKVAMAGDGQVTFGNTVLKHNARKVRTLRGGKILTGFAGATADAFTLLERFEGKLDAHGGKLHRAAVELAKEWRTDRYLRRLEAMLLVADAEATLLLSGTGDVVEPDEGVVGIGSGGPYALAAGLALFQHTDLPAAAVAREAMKVAARICIYTNEAVELDELEARHVADFTPREVVSELDRFIVGQDKGKRAVAIALRNRWRRRQVPEELREEITPKNILLIGPTGVGKTEIARRLAKLARAPFVKVEASKFTEVGYVGRDVESMVRDLVRLAVNMVQEEEQTRVAALAEAAAENRILDLLLPGHSTDGEGTREKLRGLLRTGKLDEREVEVQVSSQGPGPAVDVLAGQGMEEMGMQIQDMLGNLFPKRKKSKTVRVQEALRILQEQEAQRLVDPEKVTELALERAQNDGIIFIDEIDKIASGRDGGRGPDVSREGVQRDILPIVEGSTVNTKWGMVKTDHILFIAAGAFHMSKPSDLIPELQGRFPIRVELDSLGRAEFVRILTEPQNALTRQYVELMATEGLTIAFTEDAIEEIASMAVQVNDKTENIGARRLHTILEKVLEEVSFAAPDMGDQQVTINRAYVRDRLADIVADSDVSRYIL